MKFTFGATTFRQKNFASGTFQGGEGETPNPARTAITDIYAPEVNITDRYEHGKNVTDRYTPTVNITGRYGG